MFTLLLLGIIGFWFFECVIMQDSDSQLKAANSSDTENKNYNNTDNNKLHKIEACNLKISDKILLRNGEVRAITDIKKISNPGKILLCLGNEKRVVKSNSVYYLHNGFYSLESNKSVVNDIIKNKNIQKNTNNQFDYVHKKAERHLQHDNQLNMTCPSCQKRASSNTEVCSSCGWKLTTPYVYRKVRLAGVTYENRQSLIERMSIYDSLSIKRDLNNSYDPNAIGIYNSQNQSIGWVPKDIAASLAPIMDSGTKLKVKILKKLGGNGYNFGLEVIISNDVEKLKETPVVDESKNLAHRTSSYKASSNNYQNEENEFSVPGDIFNGVIRIRVNGKMVDTRNLVQDILVANVETKRRASQTGFDNKYFADSDKYIQTLKSVTNLQEEVCKKYNKSPNNYIEYIIGKLALEYLIYHYHAAVDFNQGNMKSFEENTKNASNLFNELQNFLVKIS